MEPEQGFCTVEFIPTVPHCTMSTLIGLMIKTKLARYLPRSIKVNVYVKLGTHNNDKEINKQLNDKERVAAAMENNNLMEIIESKIGDY